MQKSKTTLLILLSIFFINCESEQNKRFLINGKIKGDFNNYLYLKYNNNIDSVLVKDSVFSFKGNVKHPLAAYLSPGSPTSKEMMQIASFMLENNEIFISLNYSKRKFRFSETSMKILKMDSIHGSESQILKDNFDSKMTQTFYKEKNDSIKTVLLYNNLYEFISVNPKSVLSGDYLASLNNFHNYLSSHQMKNLFVLLDTSYQDENDLIFIKSLIKRREKLKIGSMPPEISLPDQDGKLISSNSFIGNFVLLDFWASWCMPCRNQNPELLQVYNSFKSSGFEILGVSLDKNIDLWKTAIEEDKIDWIQMIDTVNITYKMFHLTTIPYNLLLNKQGEIIARNIRPDKLSVLLSEKIE